jgi:hypothetical protein
MTAKTTIDRFTIASFCDWNVRALPFHNPSGEAFSLAEPATLKESLYTF